MAFTVEIKGLRELTAQFDKLPEKLQKETAAVLENGAKTWVGKAKRDAPKDMGRLAQGISYFKSGALAYTVVSSAEYSPYVEWGTKSKVQVPAEVAEYAAQFRGGKGTGNAKEMIYLWMERVGIPKERQWIVFISIVVNGIKPHPFFFKQMQQVRQQVEQQITQVVNSIQP